MTTRFPTPRSRIVLTGASGVVGQALLRELRGRDVLALVHGGAADGAETLRCDVSRPCIVRARTAADEHSELRNDVCSAPAGPDT